MNFAINYLMVTESVEIRRLYLNFVFYYILNTDRNYYPSNPKLLDRLCSMWRALYNTIILLLT